MSTAAPEKKDEKKTPPQSTLPKEGNTGSLPLKGNLTQGKVKDLTGKTIKEAPDPKVFKAAEALAKLLDTRKKADQQIASASAALMEAFKSSKRARYVRVITDHAWVFRPETMTKLIKELVD